MISHSRVKFFCLSDAFRTIFSLFCPNPPVVIWHPHPPHYQQGLVFLLLCFQFHGCLGSANVTILPFALFCFSFNGIDAFGCWPSSICIVSLQWELLDSILKSFMFADDSSCFPFWLVTNLRLFVIFLLTTCIVSSFDKERFLLLSLLFALPSWLLT